MKRSVLILVVLLATIGMVFAGGQEESTASDVITLKLCEQLPEGHIMADTMHYFGDKIEELSDGKIKCEIYTGGVLGDDTATNEGVISGAIDITRLEFTTAVNFGAKKAAVAALPYVIRDRDHFWKMAESEVGKELLDSIQEDGTGLVALTMVEEGARSFFMSSPVNDLSDIKGKKIRVQNTEFWIEIVKSLGGSPTPMSFSELYQALSTGVVDGAEQPLSGYVSQKFYEVCPYMILDGHVYPIQAYVFSEKNWNKLSAENQEIIRKAAVETSKYNKESIQKAEDEILASFEDLGVTVVNISDKTPWIEAVQPVYEKFGTPEVLEMLKKIQDVK